MAGATSACIFCQIARSSTSTSLLHSDDRVVAFEDINPSALRHYLVIPVEHISTVRDLKRRAEDYTLVSHMLDVGRMLLQRDAPQSKQYRDFAMCLAELEECAGDIDLLVGILWRFGFHRPPLNSVNHLHLHCLALPFIPRWKHMKYLSLGPLGGFIEAEKLLDKLKPE